MKKLIRFSVMAIVVATMCIACKGKSNNTEEIPVTEQAGNSDKPISVTGNELQIESNDQMQYSTNELKAHSGLIQLTLTHTGKMDKSVMGHNLVILKPGTDIAAFTQKAVLAKDTDYIPGSEKERIVAHTKLIGGGESDTIEFTISEPGTYEYICSFPGHAALMKGKLIVE